VGIQSDEAQRALITGIHKRFGHIVSEMWGDVTMRVPCHHPDRVLSAGWHRIWSLTLQQ
jgi:hypothetical protein